MNPGYHVGDCLDLLAQMPPESVHTVITSPPYYALRSYLPEDHPAKDREIGSEPTLDAFLATMVAVFRAVHRVLRDDGTLWLNIGDSYAGGAQGGTYNPETWSPLDKTEWTGHSSWTTRQNRAQMDSAKAANLPPKNLLMVPARVALALQADGWILRSDIIWSKPNPMPESCRDRPTNAHEHLFLFAKRPRYYYDGDAVREGVTGNAHAQGSGVGVKGAPFGQGVKNNDSFAPSIRNATTDDLPTSRNLRNVWAIPTQAVKFKHYATFPEALVTPCIKAGTSQEGVCVECGAPWERMVEVGDLVPVSPAADKRPYESRVLEEASDATELEMGRRSKTHRSKCAYDRTTTGWRPTCGCDTAVWMWDQRDWDRVPKLPALVLDPFMGSGTVARVAERLGREWVGVDLDERNRDMCELRLKRNQMEIPL
jgi:DNA modification methylase